MGCQVATSLEGSVSGCHVWRVWGFTWPLLLDKFGAELGRFRFLSVFCWVEGLPNLSQASKKSPLFLGVRGFRFEVCLKIQIHQFPSYNWTLRCLRCRNYMTEPSKQNL